MINGFTSDNNSYYLITKRHFHHCYTLYGFCSACGILRCSPVWCICGHKELSQEWTSKNKKLDEFIMKSQRLTKSPNEAYLEWIPFDRISSSAIWLRDGLPTDASVKLIPLETTDGADDLYSMVNYSIKSINISCLLTV